MDSSLKTIQIEVSVYQANRVRQLKYVSVESKSILDQQF